MLRRSYWECRVNPDSPHASRDRGARGALGSDLAASLHERPLAVRWGRDPGRDPGRHAVARPRASPAPPRDQPPRPEARVSFSRSGIRSHGGLSWCAWAWRRHSGPRGGGGGARSCHCRCGNQVTLPPQLLPTLQRGRLRPPTASAPRPLAPSHSAHLIAPQVPHRAATNHRTRSAHEVHVRFLRPRLSAMPCTLGTPSVPHWTGDE